MRNNWLRIPSSHLLLQNLERLQIQRHADSRWTFPLTSNERCRKTPAGVGFRGLRELLKFTKVPRSDGVLLPSSDRWVGFLYSVRGLCLGLFCAQNQLLHAPIHDLRDVQ